jgi:hypothetical protein
MSGLSCDMVRSRQNHRGWCCVGRHMWSAVHTAVRSGQYGPAPRPWRNPCSIDSRGLCSRSRSCLRNCAWSVKWTTGCSDCSSCGPFALDSGGHRFAYPSWRCRGDSRCRQFRCSASSAELVADRWYYHLRPVPTGFWVDERCSDGRMGRLVSIWRLAARRQSLADGRADPPPNTCTDRWL